MTKRKKKYSKRSSQGRKSAVRRPRSKSAQAVLPEASQLFTEPSAALKPAPALPVTERSRRERATRGGKSTLSTHELLAEVPSPARAARPATPTPRKPAQPGPRHSSGPLSQSQIYETLAALLVPYARKMESEMHPKIGFCLKAKSARTGRETHFGAVQALPDGVAYHLFPLYGHPDLLENVSPELFSRMRGKTCFHFDSLHAGLVAELAELTHAGFERFLSDGVF